MLKLHRNHFGDGIFPHIVAGFASTSCICLVVGTAEILDAVVPCVGMKPKLTAAISTIDEITKHTLLDITFWCSSFSLCRQLLYLFKYLSVNDRLISVLEDRPFFFVIGNTGFVLKGF